VGSLEGVRVLDFGRYIAGPFCGTMLADLGADVIRVEKVDGSEDRFTSPVGEVGVGSLFLHLNRNKRGFTFNPKKPGAQLVRERLVASADIVLANLTPSGLAAVGLDYASLIQIKPDVILVTSTAFGADGPFGDRVGFDGVAQAMSGNLHLTGAPDVPTRNYFPYVDFMTGSMNTIGALAALRHRDATGEGQHVQGALLASAITVAGGALIEQAVSGVNRVASGNRGQTAAPSDTFRTRDGWVLVSVVGNPLFVRWANLIGQQDWLDDPRFATDAARGEHAELVSARMQEWTGERTTAQVIDELDAARIPCGEVLTPQQALEHEQVQAMQYLQNMQYPGLEGDYPLPRMPIEFSKSAPGAPVRPPLLGEHTDSILIELGFSAAEIVQLHADRVV
jgi:crotonobetainyl-CoA:carnitine CoA-transferase CaiB-like acyl-CoA transferase